MTKYEDRSVEDLRKLAADKDIPGRSSMSKDELVAALRGEAPSSQQAPASDSPAAGDSAQNPDDPAQNPPPDKVAADFPPGESPAIIREDHSGPFAAPPPEAPVTGPDAVPLEQR